MSIILRGLVGPVDASGVSLDYYLPVFALTGDASASIRDDKNELNANNAHNTADKNEPNADSTDSAHNTVHSLADNTVNNTVSNAVDKNEHTVSSATLFHAIRDEWSVSDQSSYRAMPRSDESYVSPVAPILDGAIIGDGDVVMICTSGLTDAMDTILDALVRSQSTSPLLLSARLSLQVARKDLMTAWVLCSDGSRMRAGTISDYNGLTHAVYDAAVSILEWMMREHSTGLLSADVNTDAGKNVDKFGDRMLTSVGVIINGLDPRDPVSPREPVLHSYVERALYDKITERVDEYELVRHDAVSVLDGISEDKFDSMVRDRQQAISDNKSSVVRDKRRNER